MKLFQSIQGGLPLVFFLLIIFLSSPALRAEEIPAASPFQAGITAFKQGDYGKALRFFQQAESSGLNKPSLYYNIGVCSYKLGRYPEAEDAFRKTAAFPEMAPLAYYNLGIVAEKQADHKNALFWLRKSYDTAKTDDSKIRELAKNALREMRIAKDRPAWNRYISAGLGYDDNVELVADSDVLQASNQEDSFADLFVFLKRTITTDSSASGSFLQSGLSFLKYAEINEYDTGTANLELFYWKKLGTYQVEGGTGYHYIFFDGKSYEQSPMLSMQISRPLWSANLLRFLYRLNYLDNLNEDYDYLTGWRHRAMAELSGKWGSFRGYLAYTLEANNRDDDDYSPLRHTFTTGLKVRLQDNLDGGLTFSYRDSDYDISNQSDREEEQLTTTATLTYYLQNGWEMSCKVQHTDNESNYSSYDYKKEAVILSVARFF